MEALRKKGLGQTVPRCIADALCELISAYFTSNSNPHFLRFHPAIQEAVRDQLEVGTAMLLRGFIVKGWCRALIQMDVPNPERKIKSILTYIWDTVFTPLWETRNDVLHRHRNRVEAAEESQLTESLLWYLQNKHDVISVYDRHLMRFDTADINRMSRRFKRKWKRYLDAAREAWSIERTQLAKRQNVITRYLTSRDPLEDVVAVEPQYGL